MQAKLYESTLYLLKTLTNLHAGNGEVNYSVLDKQVQRDALTNMPQINSSSLKGAIREYINYSYIEQEDPAGDKAGSIIYTVFGSGPKEDKNKLPQKQGYVNFFDAKLLSLPVRTNKYPFMRATSQNVLNEYIQTCEIFGLSCEITETEMETLTPSFHNHGTITIEEQDWKYNEPTNLEKLSFIGENVILLKNEHFDTLAKELPFVARNYLENGKSENLWYEEIVPRESLFYFVLQRPTKVLMAHLARAEDEKILSEEEKRLAQRQKQRVKDKIVTENLDAFEDTLKNAQLFVGANTTVGYGKCKITVHTTTYAKEESDNE